MDLPPDHIMREMSRLALETATEQLAHFAEQFAKTVPPELPGAQAMIAFAAAIRSTNKKVWPKGEGRPT